MMRYQKAAAHISIVFCGMFIIFFIVDRYNPVMEFINNPITKALLFIFSLLVLFQSIFNLTAIRSKERIRIGKTKRIH